MMAAVYDQTGRVLRFLNMRPEEIPLNVEEGEAWIPLSSAPRPGVFMVDNGALMPYGLPPSPQHEFDALLRDWVRTPEAVQAEIRAERDRRLRQDFCFNGVFYQRDPDSLQRIQGAAQMANLAIAAGAQPGDLHWHGDPAPFGWIASDDSVIPMDAQTMLAFGMLAASIEGRIIHAAHQLRSMSPIPENIRDDHWWPAPAQATAAPEPGATSP